MPEYEPGTVAVATVRGVPNVRVMAGYGTAEPRLRWVTTDERLIDAEDEGWWFSYQVTDVRPLVVLDPEDREQVERFRGIADRWADQVSYSDMREPGDMDHADAMQAALREFANPTPPKPPEPTGLGAVVEDAEGRRWVRNPDPGVICKWRDAERRWRNYGAIDAVRVLSEGVQP